MREHPCHARTKPSPHSLGAVRGRTPALCHVLSCSPCLPRNSAIPFLHIVPSVAFRSVPSAPPPAWAPASGGTVFARVSCVRAFARPPARVSAGPVRAPDCARGGGRTSPPQAGRFVEGPLQCVMFCHVPHAAAEALRFRSCISFLRSVRAPPAWATPSGGTVFARVSCLRACARPRASAPARFAHLIARARRRAHLARSFPPGLFSAPAIASVHRKAKRRPREPPSLCPHSTTVSLQSSPWREKYENFSALPSFRPG